MTRELVRLGRGQVLAQYGPMRLTIGAWGPDGPSTPLAEAAGEFSFTLLPRLVPAIKLFHRRQGPFDSLRPDFSEPLLNQMVTAAQSVGQPDLGPMATVAGLVSETVALYLKEAGAVKAIVENGGDVAIWLAEGHTATAGVRLGLENPEPSYSLTLSGKFSLWGLASSGLGGRSLTMGLADTALCVAPSAVRADAAATAVANACNVDTPAARRVAAEVLRPDTDIAGLLVTESVGELSPGEIAEALENARQYAQKLVDDNVISGALVSLRGQMILTENFEDRVAPLTPVL